MKSTLLHLLMLSALGLATGSALADSGIKSRNADDAYNDLMRNFGAAPSGLPQKDVMARSEEAAYADLMRDWNAKMVGEPQKTLLVQSERARYVELMRGTFPITRLDDQ